MSKEVISKYVYCFHSERYRGLLYNARNNTFAEISKEIVAALKIAKAHPEKIKRLFCEEDLATLRRLKVIVGEQADAEFIGIQKLQHYLSAFNQSQLALTIAPTMDCNFRCAYCYEESKPKVYMTEETEDAIVEFVKAHRLTKEVFVTWYGGEPLLNFTGMQRLLSKLKTVEDKEIIHQSLITNGYLLDKSKHDYFEKFPIREVQLTLDGTKEVHDRIRVYHKPNIGTYDTILNNMQSFAKAFPKVNVNLRIHVSSETIDEFEKVCGDIAEIRSQYPNIHPYPGFISDYKKNCVLLNRQEVSNFYYDMYKKGVYTTRFFPRLQRGGCCATALNAYVIDADGELYKCWVDIGQKNRAVGTVHGIKTINEKLLADYLVENSMYDDPECKECTLLPVCDGGCTYRRMRRNKEGVATELCTALKNNLERNLETHFELKLKRNETSSEAQQN